MAVFSRSCPCGSSIELHLESQADLDFIAAAWAKLHTGPLHQPDPVDQVAEPSGTEPADA